MSNAIRSSLKESDHPGSLALTASNNHINKLPDELLLKIFRNIPGALKVLSQVSRRFNEVSKDVVFSSETFSGFSEHMRKAIREKIEKLSPERQLPVTGAQLQILAYSKLSQELTDIGLDPAAIEFTRDDLDSYRKADRLIEAKNFCLFCSSIRGITVNDERLNTKEGIRDEEMLCRKQFNTLDLTAIHSLQFWGLRLTRLPTEIGQLTALERLYLANHRLTALPESFGNLTALQQLYLEDNRLTALPESFGNLTALQRLHLANNRLTTLPESFGNLAALLWLGLANNLLTALPESFGNLAALIGLSLENNRLTALPESFRQLTALEELILSNNLLTALPNTLFELDLQSIYCDRNPLTFFQQQKFNYHFNPGVFKRDFSVGTAITAVAVCAVALSLYWPSVQTPAEEL